MSDMSSSEVMKQLFQTDNPSELFTEVFNKSIGDNNKKEKKIVTNNRINEVTGNDNDYYDNSPLPPVNLTATNSSDKRFPKTKMPIQENVGLNDKNKNVLKNLLGENYYNTLNSESTPGSGSILEGVASQMVKKQQPAAINEDYEIVEDKPKNNQITLTIEGKSYGGKIVQNKKGQILFVISQTQAFIMTPSTLKNIAKK